MRATFSITSLLALSQLASASPRKTVRQLYQFNNGTFIENMFLRPNGHLLLNTFANGTMFTLDPHAEDPKPEYVASVPGITGLTGIAQVAPDVFAVSGGVNSVEGLAFVEGTMAIFLFNLGSCSSDASVNKIADISDSLGLNGMTNMPQNPHLLLSAESNTGRVLRTDAWTGEVDVAVEDDLLRPSDPPRRTGLGVNGVHATRNYLYFTNSDQGIFGRIPVDALGSRTGATEIINQIPANDSHGYDDFSLSRKGAAYVGKQQDSVVKIYPDGRFDTLLDPDSEVVVKAPTSTVLSKDEKTLYIVTGGGQIIAYDL